MNYLQDSTSSSISEVFLNQQQEVDHQNQYHNSLKIKTTSSYNNLASSNNNVHQNLITYELIRYNTNSGFGFDLKGERPCIIGSVRKDTIADQAGIEEGDLVISINNRKVTDLDHDQVVRLVGISKNRLVLQVTKFKIEPNNTNQQLLNKAKKKPICKSSNFKSLNTIGIGPTTSAYSHKKSRSRSKRNKYRNITQSSQSTASSSGFDINLTTNTKTTEDDEDEDNESDLEFYYGTTLAPLSTLNRKNLRSNRIDNLEKKYRKTYVNNKEYVDYFDDRDIIDDVDTENTEPDTEDTENNSNLFNNQSENKLNKINRNKTRTQHYNYYHTNTYCHGNRYSRLGMVGPVSTRRQAIFKKASKLKELEDSQDKKIVNNVSIESSELEYEPELVKKQISKCRYTISSKEAVNLKTKQQDYKFYKENYQISIDDTNSYKRIQFDKNWSTINDNPKQQQQQQEPVCLIKANQQTEVSAKIASIKHFNSVNQIQTQNEHLQTYFSLNCLNSNTKSIKQLNVNDLYAILEPVVHPFLYKTKLSHQLNQMESLCFSLVYLGSIFIPYDTLSNASKLTSIRNSIENFLIVKSNELNDPLSFSCLINLNIYTDRIKLTNLNSNKNEDCVYYYKSEIAFCGKIKNDNQLFALVVLSQQDNTDMSSSCLIFRYITTSSISLDYILNEISRLYRNQNYVFSSSIQSLASTGSSPSRMAHSNPKNNSFTSPEALSQPLLEAKSFLSSSVYSPTHAPNLMSLPIKQHDQYYDYFTNNYSNLNYDYITDQVPSYNNDVENTSQFGSYMIHDKNTNDIYFSKENFLIKKSTSQSDQFLKDISSLSNIDENFDSINTSCASKSSKTANKKTPAKNKSAKASCNSKTNKKNGDSVKNVDYNQSSSHQSSQSIKLIKENLANIFLSKKPTQQPQLNDLEVLKTIETETNKNILKQQSNKQLEEVLSSSSTNLKVIGDSSCSSSLGTNRSLSIKIKSKILPSHSAFKFLKSKPPVHQPNANPIKITNNEDEDFYDANQVLNSCDSNHQFSDNQHQTTTSSTTGVNNPQSFIRLSYPFLTHLEKSNQQANNLINISGKASVTSTAKRLLFNFMNGVGVGANGTNTSSSNSSSSQNNPKSHDNLKLANIFSQQRRLSDFHRPNKPSIGSGEENGITCDKINSNTPIKSNKLNQTKVSLMSNSLTDVNDSNKIECEFGRCAKWATGFEKLLEDSLGLQIFTEFLKKELSEENIDFWVKCENFKKLTDPNEMKQKSLEIWNTYLDTSGICQINVDNKARNSCQEALQNPNISMFEMAQTQIFSLMKYDSYPRFLKSQMYKDCIVNEMVNKPIRTAVAARNENK